MNEGNPFSRGKRDDGSNQRVEDRVRRLEALRASEIPIEAIAGSTARNVQEALEGLQLGVDARVELVAAPATAASTGAAGQVAYDADYWYVCVATDTWKRVAIATW